MSDAKKRELYDRGGEKAIKEGGIASEMRSPMDIFDMFFNMGHARSHRGPPRGRDVAHQMAVTLEDLYSGAVRKLALQKNIICPQCKGLFRLYVELHVFAGWHLCMLTVIVAFVVVFAQALTLYDLHPYICGLVNP